MMLVPAGCPLVMPLITVSASYPGILLQNIVGLAEKKTFFPKGGHTHERHLTSTPGQCCRQTLTDPQLQRTTMCDMGENSSRRCCMLCSQVTAVSNAQE